MPKKCNGCKRNLEDSLFTRNYKVYARCNDCSKNSSQRKNICETCGIRACFNNKGLKWGRFCSSHKEVGMINVLTHKCEYEGCKIEPTFNFEGEKRGRFCASHKELGMVDIKSSKCEHEECKKFPNFNYEGETKRRFCSKHKELGMVNVNSSKCEHKGCNKSPSYNHEGETKRRFCLAHKELGMVDIKSSRCEHEGCYKQPFYNFEGEKRGRFCSSHKELGMVDVKSSRCEHEECKLEPTCNFEGEKRGRFCSSHKELGMVDVKSLKCEHEGCNKTPTFNFEGEKRGRFCSKHKLSDMVDIKHNRCKHEGCKTICFFGYCGSSPSHCCQHKLDYMINKPKRTCTGNENEDCKEIAIYGKDEPVHCEEHRLIDEICWLVKKCNNCGRDNELLNKDDLCGICCDKPFYEEGKRINKIKETIMVRYLRNNINGNEILADRIIDSTCNLYRPDILYDCGTHIVVVECDENQHKSYNWESCSLNKSLEHMEEKRMYEIMVAYGLPAIFIRWNPDSFKVDDNIVKKYNNDKRLETLVKWVKYCFKMDVKLGEVVYKKLFYDGYEEDDLKFKKINEKDLL